MGTIWQVDINSENGETISIEDASGDEVAHALAVAVYVDEDGGGEWEINDEVWDRAHLIAEAPDMRQVLTELVAHVDTGDTDDLDFGRGLAQSGIIDRARAILARLAKAKGEP